MKIGKDANYCDVAKAMGVIESNSFYQPLLLRMVANDAIIILRCNLRVSHVTYICILRMQGVKSRGGAWGVRPLNIEFFFFSKPQWGHQGLRKKLNRLNLSRPNSVCSILPHSLFFSLLSSSLCARLLILQAGFLPDS